MRPIPRPVSVRDIEWADTMASTSKGYWMGLISRPISDRDIKQD